MTAPNRRTIPAASRRLARGMTDERGQITAFVVVILAALLLIAGIVYDGGRALDAKTRALDEAQEAARAGAQAVDLPVFRANGTVILDPAQAVADARAYVAATGSGDSAIVTVTAEAVTVTVSAVQPTLFLGLAGVTSLHVAATATADAETGITGPNTAAARPGENRPVGPARPAGAEP